METNQIFNELFDRLNQKLDQNLKDINLQQNQTAEDLKNINCLLLPWDRFSEWIHSICLVTFDIEVGQAIEKIYPSSTKLTEREKTNICYLSFPDSNSGCMGDTKFHFRTRLCPIRRTNTHTQKEISKELHDHYPIDPNFLYGFVYFRQVKDRTARRGYFQKSLIILTKYPFVNLFYKVVSIIAPQFFDNGEDVINLACKCIDRWPALNVSVELNLNLLNININTVINIKFEKVNKSPTKEFSLINIYEDFDKDKGQSSQQLKYELGYIKDLNESTNIYIPNVLSSNVYNDLLPVISHIQIIWEIVITCEPLIVMAPTPDICSSVVQSLISIIQPLKYTNDYRPFFTIHDSEFKEYTTKAQASPPVILGVTNPFFAKTLQHWPHIIRIGDYSSSQKIKDAKILKSECIKTLDNNAGLYTKYKPYLQKDRTILKKLLKGIECKRMKEVQNVILSRYFQELTHSFLMPLERYITSLMPLQKNISPFKSIPKLNPFNPDDFLKSLETSGPQLTTGIKGDWSNLYKRFFRCANFAYWHENRFREISKKIKALHIESICKANLVKFVADKDEVEVIDIVLRMKQKLNSIFDENLPISSANVDILKGHIQTIIETLPQDIQLILQKLIFVD